MNEHCALILSGHLGAGHDVVAEACADALSPHGVKSRVLDAMELLGRAGGPAGDAVFKTLFWRPTVYDGFHFSHLRRGSRVARGLDRLAVRNIWPRFMKHFESTRPDLLISVFATGAATAARLRRERDDDVLSVVLCTDTWLHRMWVHDETDLFLVTSQTAAESVHAYRPRASVEIVPAPARPAFYDAPSRSEARAMFEVPDDARCVLLMSGAWGVGPIDEVALRLSRAGLFVLAVAGRNRKFERKLGSLAKSNPSIRPFGFTEQVPELMAACDVVVTSSGDTCTEARVVGRGMVLLDVVPGHGRENLMHQLELGNAAVCMPDPATIADAVMAFLDDPARSEPPPVRSRDAWEAPFLAALDRIGYSLD
ncbi:MAG: glycosyl hydrolase [Actinobacteria bacterium]|nr:glycosyl hydrolase [Actinomycetota bacterium]